MTRGEEYWASMREASSPGMVWVSLVSRARRTLGELKGVASFDMVLGSIYVREWRYLCCGIPPTLAESAERDLVPIDRLTFLTGRQTKDATFGYTLISVRYL
jgi:hypothetical protein